MSDQPTAPTRISTAVSLAKTVGGLAAALGASTMAKIALSAFVPTQAKFVTSISVKFATYVLSGGAGLLAAKLSDDFFDDTVTPLSDTAQKLVAAATKDKTQLA